MPIRRELRWLYPIDWPQLSWTIRFDRARGRCETCRRPHRQTVRCLPDGRWLDEAADPGPGPAGSGPPDPEVIPAGQWRDGHGRRCPLPSPADLAQLRTTRVVLATAHLDHDPANNRRTNLRGLCQRSTCGTTSRTTAPSAGSPTGCGWRSATCSLGHTAGGESLDHRRTPQNRPDSTGRGTNRNTGSCRLR